MRGRKEGGEKDEVGRGSWDCVRVCVFECVLKLESWFWHSHGSIKTFMKKKTGESCPAMI